MAPPRRLERGRAIERADQHANRRAPRINPRP
ncbi:hypothetical protein M218_13280 [Burkholderia pseudomallei MSHR338]|nr:hypothetical protein BPC006_I2841 [Burkholderia pseudomallei BPC006]EMP76470.1 hypothetical protein D512_14391 [Burkholderia pseudomallei MSHR1043]EQA88528.1 hypothetical protein M218_13280 [Burkholderia pseudomallei MSHR338]VUD51325.1 unnamed protein product [Burkholderia pseudomallei]